MKPHENRGAAVDADVTLLSRLGYAQELRRRMGDFSNFAIAMSAICVLAGGVTSFHLGFCSVGPAAIGLGWPLVALFSLVVAATLGQVASAFPTAGGLYHWASILGGRGWGWLTAWFNLAGLVTVLAATNVGTTAFALGTLGPQLGYHPERVDPRSALMVQGALVSLITASQALLNHLSIRLTTALTDLGGSLIVAVALGLTLAMLAYAPALEPVRLVRVVNYSGTAGGGVWPASANLTWLFVLGWVLPAYTITGFDASAHAAEETVGAAQNVPRGMVRAVAVSGLAGWVMLAAVVLAVPDLDVAAARGEYAFAWIMGAVLPGRLALVLNLGIVLAQYVCGLAALTSASRMAFAFARDGGLPGSRAWRWVCPRRRTPVVAVWGVATLVVLFTLSTRVYATISVVCTIFLYLSYMLPTALGAWAHGRSWTKMGPWNLGRWYRPLACVNVLGCGLLIAIGMQPPYDQAATIVAGALVALAAGWFLCERHRFPGPPPVRDEEA